MSFNTGNRTVKCYKCKSTINIISHHVSYDPEITKPCCRSCHQTIHAKKQKITAEEMIISINASNQKKAKRLSPIDFNINEVREQINNLLNAVV